jgi:hypothetical protein
MKHAVPPVYRGNRFRGFFLRIYTAVNSWMLISVLLANAAGLLGREVHAPASNNVGLEESHRVRPRRTGFS